MAPYLDGVDALIELARRKSQSTEEKLPETMEEVMGARQSPAQSNEASFRTQMLADHIARPLQSGMEALKSADPRSVTKLEIDQDHEQELRDQCGHKHATVTGAKPVFPQVRSTDCAQHSGRPAMARQAVHEVARGSNR